MRPKLLQRIDAHPAVDYLSIEPDLYFVYLKVGWAWSGQTSFGCETLTEAWQLVKQARRDA